VGTVAVRGGTWEGRRRPSALAASADLPWTRIANPEEAGARCSPDRVNAGAYLFVDFLDLEAARIFAALLHVCPGKPLVLGPESMRFTAERM